jgi:hypothetical protein
MSQDYDPPDCPGCGAPGPCYGRTCPTYQSESDRDYGSDGNNDIRPQYLDAAGNPLHTSASADLSHSHLGLKAVVGSLPQQPPTIEQARNELRSAGEFPAFAPKKEAFVVATKLSGRVFGPFNQLDAFYLAEKLKPTDDGTFYTKLEAWPLWIPPNPLTSPAFLEQLDKEQEEKETIKTNKRKQPEEKKKKKTKEKKLTKPEKEKLARALKGQRSLPFPPTPTQQRHGLADEKQLHQQAIEGIPGRSVSTNRRP